MINEKEAFLKIYVNGVRTRCIIPDIKRADKNGFLNSEKKEILKSFLTEKSPSKNTTKYEMSAPITTPSILREGIFINITLKIIFKTPPTIPKTKGDMIFPDAFWMLVKSENNDMKISVGERSFKKGDDALFLKIRANISPPKNKNKKETGITKIITIFKREFTYFVARSFFPRARVLEIKGRALMPKTASIPRGR